MPYYAKASLLVVLAQCVLLSATGVRATLDGLQAAGPRRSLAAAKHVLGGSSSSDAISSSYTDVQQQTTSTDKFSKAQPRKLQSPTNLGVTGEFTSITIPVDMCGSKPSLSNDEISKQVMGDPRSLQAYFKQCSYGQLTLDDDPSKNLVLSKPVPIRDSQFCSGSTVTNCDLDAVASKAEEYIADELGIDMTLYSVKILVFPTGVDKCGFNGMARQNCFTNEPGPGVPARACRIWMTDFNARGLQHEAGHTLGLGHADKGNVESDDATCPMSNHQGYYCLNAYHSSLLGWTKPLQTLDFGSTSANSWQNVRLPARAATSDNFLKLTGKGVDLFVSYTAPLGWESDEADKFKRTLLVHSMKSEQDWSHSEILAALKGGESTDLGGSYPRWVVRLAEGASLAEGTAQVCRAQNLNDCDPSKAPNGSGAAAAALNKLAPSPPKKSTKRPPPPRS